MSLPITIRGSNDRGHEAQVTVDGALLVATYPAELRDLGDQKNARRFFADYFKTTAGSSQMAVDGSITPVRFYVSSDAYTSNGVRAVPRAKAIRSLRVILEGPNLDPTAQGELRQFGPVLAPGLTNGMQLYTYQGPFVTSYAPASIKTLWDFIKFASTFQSFPGALAQNVDGFIADFPFADPVIIGFGATDHLEVVIGDNLTGFTNIQVLAQGWYELEHD